MSVVPHFSVYPDGQIEETELGHLKEKEEKLTAFNDLKGRRAGVGSNGYCVSSFFGWVNKNKKGRGGGRNGRERFADVYIIKKRRKKKKDI